MPCCCLNILNLCNKPVCGQLEIDQVATSESGVINNYTLVVDYIQTQLTIRQLQTEGENIKFDIGDLNENFQYTGQIFDSAGNLVTIGDSPNTYDCIKFKTFVSLGAHTGIGSNTDQGTVIIESVVDDDITISGTTHSVSGITDGSNTVVSDAFIGVRVFIVRGSIPLPGIDPMDGGEFYTKTLGADFITFSSPLVAGEFLRIETIPE